MNRVFILSFSLALALSAAACGPDSEGDEPGECADGTDNDQDGLADCNDPGCAVDADCIEDDTADDDDTAGDDDTADDDDSAGDDDDTVGDDDDTTTNSVPTITSAEINPAAGDETTTFSCTGVGWSDPDGDPEAYLIQWFVNGVAASVEPTITGDLFDREDLLTCTAQPFDGQLYGATAWSSPVVIGNAPPTVDAVILTLDAAGGFIDATPSGAHDPDSDPVTFTYSWTIDGQGAGDSSETLSTALLTTNATVTATAFSFDGISNGGSATASMNFIAGIHVAPLDLGETEAGCVLEEPTTITNLSGGPTEITAVWMEDISGYGDLDVELDYPLPFTLAAGDSITASVEYAPTDLPPSNGIIHVENSSAISDATAPVQGAAHFGVPATDAATLTASIDILFVVDNSCSMSQEQGVLGAAGQNFFDELDLVGIDYHVGVVTTDSGALQGVVPVIDNTTPNPADVFAANVDVGVEGSFEEKAFFFAHAALTDPVLQGANAGFQRLGTDLMVIIVTDEPEQSSVTWAAASDWVTAMEAIPGFSGQLHVSGISGGSAGCNGTVTGSATAAPRLVDAVTQTGGLDLSICSDEWSTHMSDLGGWASNSGSLTSTIRLSETPAPGSIEVQLNGSNIGFGWTYSPTINSIVLNPPGAEGDSVVVRYRVFGGNCAPNLAPTSGISGSGLGSTCEPVVLTDLGASDPDGTLTHWYWSIESAPTASIMQHQWLDASVDGELTFYPDASGTWEVGLVVVDDDGAGAPLVSMPITVAPGGNPANTLPQVTIDQATYIISETSTCTYNSVNGETLLEGCTPCVFQPIDLDASNSHDPDGGWLVHSWSLVGTPATSWHLSGSDQDIASLSWIGGMEMALPGTSAETAQVELLVSDCNGDTVTLHTTVQVQCTAS